MAKFRYIGVIGKDMDPPAKRREARAHSAIEAHDPEPEQRPRRVAHPDLTNPPRRQAG